ncbi:MAG TPA: LacI family DNA-binding transcriptional regulator, partial [Bacteroidota bacterium]
MKNQSKSRPTIHDVAKKSGLSLSTVSLVLNNKSNVSKGARKRIQEVIAELNYHPRRSARGLASQSSGNFGFLLTDDHFSLEEPFYTRIFLGSELEARKHQYYILLTTVGPTVRETKEMPRFFLEQNVDGVIIAGKIGASWIEYIQERNLPVILIDYELQGHPVSTVTMDNRGGSTLVMEHLISLGHKKIGFIGGDLKHPSIAERFRSYGDAMKTRNFEIHQSWISIAEPDTRIENGYRAAQQLFGKGSEQP